MAVIDQLAYSLNRRDEGPNIELAKNIIQKKDKAAIKELMLLLHHKNANILSDAIKVLYEIGEINPGFISDHLDDFVSLLHHKNNRLVWGAMAAINAVTSIRPDEVYRLLPHLADAANNGSVITRDRYVYLLAKLESGKKYKGKLFPLILEQIRTCPINQCGMYAECTLPLITKKNKGDFLEAVQSRLKDAEKETIKKRLMKILQKTL